MISSSDDSILYEPLEEDDKVIDVTDANVQHEIKTKANKEPLNFDKVAEEIKVEDVEIVSPKGEQPQETLFEEAQETSNTPGF